MTAVEVFEIFAVIVVVGGLAWFAFDRDNKPSGRSGGGGGSDDGKRKQKH